ITINRKKLRTHPLPQGTDLTPQGSGFSNTLYHAGVLTVSRKTTFYRRSPAFSSNQNPMVFTRFVQAINSHRGPVETAFQLSQRIRIDSLVNLNGTQQSLLTEPLDQEVYDRGNRW